MNGSSFLNQAQKGYQQQDQENIRQSDYSSFLTPNNNNNQSILNEINHNNSSSQQLFRGRINSRNNQLTLSPQMKYLMSSQHQSNIVNSLNANRMNIQQRNRTYLKERQDPSQKIFQALKIKILAQKLMANLNRFMPKDLLNLFTDKTIFFQINNHQNQNGLIDTQSHLYKKVSKFEDYYQSFSNILDNSTCIQKLAAMLNQIPVFSPSGYFKFIWDIIMIIVILLYLFMIPIQVTFYLSLQELFPDNVLLLCNIALILDFIFSWNFGFFDKGQPNMNRIQVMTKYFRQQFYLDLASSLFILIDFFWQNNITIYAHLLFFLRYKNIKRFFKRVEERFNMSPLIIQVTSLVQLLLLILIVAHIISCVWIEVVQYEINNNIPNTWIGDRNFKQDDWLSYYIQAYYYSTVTMITVGYGDFKPVNQIRFFNFIFFKLKYLIQFMDEPKKNSNHFIINYNQSNHTEMVISIITMLISCGVFAYSINAIGTIFNTLNQKSLDKKNNMYTISSYMAKKNINFELQMQIKEYLEYYWDIQYSRDKEQEQNLINQLSPNLKDRLLFETFKMIILDCQIFKDNFSQLFVMDMIQLIQECSYRPDEIIVSESIQDDHSIYFIESGEVQVFVDEDAKKVLKCLKKGDYFGDFSFFTGQSTNMNYKATEFTQVFKIKRSSIFDLFKNRPSDLETFCNIKDNLQYMQNYSMINSKCYYCQEFHQTTNCQKLFPQFNKIRIANISNQSELQIRSQAKRERKLNKYAEFLFQEYSQNMLQQYITDFQQDIDYYYSKYISKEEEYDEYDELQENDDQKDDIQSSFNIHSQEDLASLDQEKQKSRLFSRNLSQLSLKKNKLSSSNIEEESQMQKSPAPKLKPKSNIFDDINTQNNQGYLNSNFNLPELNPINFKKVNSKDQQQNIDSPMIKRKLIKIQQIQTNLKTLNLLQQRQSLINEQQLQENHSIQSKYADTPIRVPSHRTHLTKNNQIYDVKNIKEQISPTKIFLEQKNSELVLKLQQIFENQNNLKDKKENEEDNNEYDIQRNFEIYLPHNNLSYIIEYLQFKSRFLKQLKFSFKNGNQNIKNNQQTTIQNENSNQENYLYQYPFNVPGSQRNFQVLRVFEKRILQQNLKKKQKICLGQQNNSNSRNSLPNTKLQKVLEQFQFVSQNQEENISYDFQMIPAQKQTNYQNNQIYSFNAQSSKNDSENSSRMKQNTLQNDQRDLLYSQTRNKDEEKTNCIYQQSKLENNQASHFQKSYFQKKQRLSLTLNNKTPPSKNFIISNINILQINQREQSQEKVEDQDEILSPSLKKQLKIHSSQKIAQKEQYFQGDDDNQDIDITIQAKFSNQNRFQQNKDP